MRIKKMLAAGMASLLLSGLFVVPVSAHGHGHHQANTSYPVCTVEDCTEEGLHCHDDEYYCGYDHSSGYCDGSCTTRSRSRSYRKTSGHCKRH